MNDMLFVLELLIGFGLVISSLYIAGALGLMWIGLCATILMNLFVLKTFTVFGLHVTGGNTCFAMVFLCTDLLSEYYGASEARKLVWGGFAVSFVAVILSQLTLGFTPSPDDIAQPALSQIMGWSPRIVTVSLISYLLSQHLSIAIYTGVKKMTHGKWIWLRSNCATVISQAFDTVFFTLGALYGILDHLDEVLVTTFAMKLILAACDTPFVYLGKWVLALRQKKSLLPEEALTS